MIRYPILLLALTFVAHAPAATIFTNYPPAGTSEVQVIPGLRYALGFDVGSQSMVIDSLTLRLWAASPNGANLSLYSNVAGAPGIVLEQFVTPTLNTTHGVDYTFAASTQVSLTPNARYFAVFSVPAGQINWLPSTTAFTATDSSNFSTLFSQDSGSTWGSPLFPFVGSIQAVGTVAPEPDSVVLLASVAAISIFFRKRKLPRSDRGSH